MGGPRRSPRESVDAVEQAIVEIREFWRHDGKYDGPAPAHPIGIWLGAYGPRMLRITGTLADGWVPSMSYMPPEKAVEAMKRVDDAAQAEGRDPASIRRVYNLLGDDGFEPEQLAGYVTDVGFDTFIFSGLDEDGLRRVASDLIPAVREEVARRRASS